MNENNLVENQRQAVASTQSSKPTQSAQQEGLPQYEELRQPSNERGGLTKIPPKFSRRIMLAMLGGGAVSAALKAILPVPAAAADSVPEVATQAVPQPEAAPTKERRKIFDGIRIFFDEKETPLAYRLDGQKKNDFTADELEKFKKIKQFAIDSSESKVAVQFKVDLPVELAEPTPERPYVTEKPDDVLSDEEMAKRGVTVINQESIDNYSNLYLREAIFGEGGILEPLRLLNDNLIEGEEQTKLIICNVNAPWVESDYWSHLPDFVGLGIPYESMWNRANVYYLESLDYYQRLIDWDKLRLQQLRDDHQQNTYDYQAMQRQLFEDEARKMELEGMTAAESLFYFMVDRTHRAIGRYYHQRETNESVPGDVGNDAVVFIASPDLGKVADKKRITLGFTDLGKLIVDTQYLGSMRSPKNTPRLDMSYPRVDEHTELGPNDEYRYSAGSVGFIVYHEIAHHILINVFPKLAEKGILKDSTLYQYLRKDELLNKWFDDRGVTNNYFPSDRDERITDTVAMKMIERAHNNWVGTGETDDTGYQLVFQVPGGYQITGQPTLQMAV